MEIKSKVKGGYLVVMFPIEGLKEEEIEYLKDDIWRAYKITKNLIIARRVLDEEDKGT